MSIRRTSAPDQTTAGPDRTGSTRRTGRLARLLAGGTAAAALTTGLLAVAAPADASVVDPSGRQISSAVYCDNSSPTFSLVAAPVPGAVARVTTRAIETGLVSQLPDLYPVASTDQSTLYQYDRGPGRYALYIEYWWQDAVGNWSYAGEWATDYFDYYGNRVHECNM
jgi:hypothetical protein